MSIHLATSGTLILDPHFLSVVRSNVLIPGLKAQTRMWCDLSSLRKKKGLSKMIPRLWSVCQTSIFTHTWVNRAVGVTWPKMCRGTTERMRSPIVNQPGKICFLYLLGGDSGDQCAPADGCLLFLWVRQDLYSCLEICNGIFHVTKSTTSSYCSF